MNNVCWMCLATAALGASLSFAQIPQVAAGDGWKTIFRVYNPHSAGPFRIRFYDRTGRPLQMPLRYENGVVQAKAEHVMNLQLREVTVLETEWSGPLLEGFAINDQQGLVTAIVRQSVPGRPDFEAQINNPLCHRGVTFAFDNRSGFSTGVALLNNQTLEHVIRTRIYNAKGERIVDTFWTMAPTSREVFSLSEKFPATLNSAGSAEFLIVASSGRTQLLCGVGLLFNPSGSFTTMQLSVPPVE
jgi:hypothetical protein